MVNRYIVVWKRPRPDRLGHVPAEIRDLDGSFYEPGKSPAEGSRGIDSWGAGRTADEFMEWYADVTSVYGWNYDWLESDLSMRDALDQLREQFFIEHPDMALTTAGPDVPQTIAPSPTAEPPRSGTRDDRAAQIGERQQFPFPASRFVLAESWWIASELVTRHPELVIHEMHPGGGMYDCLALLRPGESPLAHLNRSGSISVPGSPTFRLSWAVAIAADDPHWVVKGIEAAADLTLAGKRPPTTARSVAYRVIAAILRLQSDDRHAWDVRNEFLDSSEWRDDEDTHRGYLRAFPDAVAVASGLPRIGIYDEPHSHFWAVLRDEEPVALITIDGLLIIQQGTVSLLDAYRANGRRILSMLVAELGSVLR